MQAHYLQHVPFEGLGSIEAWLKQAAYSISSTRLFCGEKLPRLENIDLLIIMGGPMSVNDEASYPWLVQEKQFIKNAIESGIPVLGICLGAQLIANTLGAKVYPNMEKEIGWFPIEAVEPDNNLAFKFPRSLEVFHWHGETFDLPEGAVRLAKSKACSSQAFQISDNVIGLQFHLETTTASAEAIIRHCNDELVEGLYIQSEAEILSAVKEQYSNINTEMNNILEYLHVAKP